MEIDGLKTYEKNDFHKENTAKEKKLSWKKNQECPLSIVFEKDK